ncbi:AMP-binding protein [Neptunicella sp. SCSIO 80796]|uniref:AMP-binding protein n=1 Tax=Neptunicella plasticusilytica TaxID=3117012 RepID=UPI003A4DD078
MFFSGLQQFGDDIALIEGDTVLCYADLQQRIDSFRKKLPQNRQLVVLQAGNDITTLVTYLTCLQAGHVVIMVDKQIAEPYLQSLVDAYYPNWLVKDAEISFVTDYHHVFDDDLALLLSTSGSTGSPKQVALSKTNLQSNADSICQYLPILASDKTITTLAPFYSYGLSVLNSHLLVGATIVLTEHSLVSREFWTLFEQHQINSFAGVPYSYEMLLRLRFTRKNLPDLRYFTQAGGKLATGKVAELAQYAQQQDKRFFVMYGQTEATARMAFNADPLAKPESIGRVIPGGEFCLQDEQGRLVSGEQQQGELVYRGANIMLGYSRNKSDLCSFSSPDYLATGDLAYRDADGDYFISGRLARFIKPFSVRLNLDEVEALLADNQLTVAAVGNDNKLQVGVQKSLEKPNDIRVIQQMLSQQLHLHPSVIQLAEFDMLPLTSSGKRDYATLQAWFDSK